MRICKADGISRLDFTGTLYFDWPASVPIALFGPRRRPDVPLFTLGYGLS